MHASGLLPSPLSPPPPTTAASTTSSCSSPCCERNFAVRRGEGEEEVQTFLSFSGIGWKGRRKKKNFHIPRTRAPLHEKRAENSMNTFPFPSPSLPPFSLDFSGKRGSLLSQGGLQIDYKSALYRQTTRFLAGECGPLSRSPTKTALSTSPTHHHSTDRLQSLMDKGWNATNQNMHHIIKKYPEHSAIPQQRRFFCF